MNKLKLLVLGQQSVELFYQLKEKYKFHKNITLVKGNKIEIGILVDNMIHHIINRNLLLKTNVNIIVMLEEHSTILTELIMIGTKCENMSILIVK